MPVKRRQNINTRLIKEKQMTRLEKELNDVIDSIFFPSRLTQTFAKSGASYPPYNIVRLSDEKTVLELAVAGFKETDLTVSVEDGHLRISGKKEESDAAKYLYKGIGTRAFERVFTLAKDTKIDGAEYADGILSIFISYEIPEEKKPKQIEIHKGERLYLTE
jgi:molecular chaperone IbpA